MLKFRSMTDETAPDGDLLPDAQRLPPFGQFLRASSLDELPGLVNVWRGDLSLVGPRPLLMQYLPLYSPRQRRRHEVRPGLTGLAQVNGRNSLSWDAKLELDAIRRVRFLPPGLRHSRQHLRAGGAPARHQRRGTCDGTGVHRKRIERLKSNLLAGTPTTVAPGRTLRVTTAPAPTVLREPIRTPGMGAGIGADADVVANRDVPGECHGRRQRHEVANHDVMGDAAIHVDLALSPMRTLVVITAPAHTTLPPSDHDIRSPPGRRMDQSALDEAGAFQLPRYSAADSGVADTDDEARTSQVAQDVRVFPEPKY